MQNSSVLRRSLMTLAGGKKKRKKSNSCVKNQQLDCTGGRKGRNRLALFTRKPKAADLNAFILLICFKLFFNYNNNNNNNNNK